MTVVPLPEPTRDRPLFAATLDDLATVANAEHCKVDRAVVDARAAMSSGVVHGIYAGEALLEARRRVEEGDWARWLEANVQFSAAAAQIYMRLAWYRDRLDVAETPLTVLSAVAYLKGLPAPHLGHKPGWMKTEALRLKIRGLNFTQIAEVLGVTPITAHRWVDPRYDKQVQIQKNRQRAARLKAQQASERERTAAAVKAKGGPAAEAYALVRRCAAQLDIALADSSGSDERLALRMALAAAHKVDDAIVVALGLGRRS